MRLRSKMPRIEPVRDRDGKITESRSMVIDISSLKDTEKSLILKVLKETKWNKYQAAKKLGITRSTLYGKMRRHGIMVPSNN